MQHSSQILNQIHIIDSHTGGEPTRCVIRNAPDLGGGSLPEQASAFRKQHSEFRSAVINEPRGSEVIVGAIVCDASDPDCVAGVIFFNNVDVLHMCGHGTIGLAVTLAHLGRIAPGKHFIDTPVGKVGFELHDDGHRVTIQNVPAYRLATEVVVDVDGYGPVVGDIAWGGNWFFLVGDHGQELHVSRVEALTHFTKAIRRSLERDAITGKDGQIIDHIELFGPSHCADSQNFVLCPGGAYDRSPCGTGTSAKLACLAADGKLQPGEPWRQESIIGSCFDGSFQWNADGTILPQISGSAWITAETTLYRDNTDPFRNGIQYE